MENIAGEIKKRISKLIEARLNLKKNIKTDLVKILKESLPRPNLLVENVYQTSCEGKVDMYSDFRKSGSRLKLTRHFQQGKRSILIINSQFTSKTSDFTTRNYEID
jgi:hypothetical protein